MEWTPKQAFDFFEIATPNEGEYKEDDMGVELEIEYENIQETVYLRGFLAKLNWKSVDDNSLRGVGIEHVSPPQSLEKTYTDMLAFDKFIEGKYPHPIIKPSHRCSTHVHLNFDNSGILDIIKFTALYYIFEPLLAQLSGPDRVSNCFCISTQVIPQTISDNIMLKKPFYKTITDADAAKYSSINFCRLHDLGTIEIRLMKGYEKAIKLKNWLTVLRDLKKSSKNRFKSLEDINQKYLDLPYKDFIEYVFPEGADAIFAAKVPDLKQLLAEGYRASFVLLETHEMLQKAVLAVEKARVDEAKNNEKLKLKLAKFRERALVNPEEHRDWWNDPFEEGNFL